MLKALEIVKNAQDNMYSKCNLEIEKFSPEDESSEYYAHIFTIKGKKGLFRIAKKTPTKSGWFVTIWKRGADSIIAPYEESDTIDFVVIAVSDGNNVGEFIFPKTVLAKKNIFSANGKEGKRAIRVYTPWDKTTSAQAAKTQKWQHQFFVDLNSSCSESTLKINNLYSM
jgi:hypothetical protein